jgi:cell division protein FtsB
MRKRLFDLIVFSLCLGLYGYFGWHYFHGPRSVARLAEIEDEARMLGAKLVEIVAARKSFERKISHLRPENIDPDMLDETARRSLGYVRPDELIINIK